jgi:endonuclease G
MKKCLISLLLTLVAVVSYSQGITPITQNIIIKNNVFEVLYSQSLEQPLKIKYRSTNRPTNVNRGSMDFYKEPNIKTSDADDYKANIYDKGHGAPAATFSDNQENLKQTFSYLNCILQDQYLNRGEWRLLEEQERKWDDTENLTVLINIVFDNPVKRLPTNAAIPSHLQKHIYFETQKEWRCFVFLNERPKFKWHQLEMVCPPSDHQ